MGKSSSAKNIRKQNSVSPSVLVTLPKWAVYKTDFYTSRPMLTGRMQDAVNQLLDAIELNDPEMTANAFDEVLNSGVVYDSMIVHFIKEPNRPAAPPLSMAIGMGSLNSAKTLITKVIETDTDWSIGPILVLDQTISLCRAQGVLTPEFFDVFQHFCDTCAKFDIENMLTTPMREMFTAEGRAVFDKAAYTEMAAIEEAELEALVAQPLPEASVAPKVAMRL